MKLDFSFTPDLVALMRAEVAAGQKAVSTTMAQAGASLKSAWRTQITSAGLGARLANTIGLPLYARQLMDDKDRWINILTEASILPVNKRPRTAIRLFSSN